MTQKAINETQTKGQKFEMDLEERLLDKYEFFKEEYVKPIVKVNDGKIVEEEWFHFGEEDFLDADFAFFAIYRHKNEEKKEAEYYFYNGSMPENLSDVFQDQYFFDQHISNHRNVLGVGILDYIMNKYLKKENSKLVFGEQLIKYFKNIREYMEYPIFDDIFTVKFIKSEKKDILEFFKKNICDNIQEKQLQNEVKDFGKRTKLFIKNEIKELKEKENATAPDQVNIQKLEAYLDMFQQFPDHYVNIVKKYLIEESTLEMLFELAVEEFHDKLTFFKENVSEFLSTIELKQDYRIEELFALIPTEYLNDSFYDLIHPMNDQNVIPFISSFVKICKDFCKKSDGKDYETKEIVQFLMNQYRQFNRNFQDSIIDVGYEYGDWNDVDLGSIKQIKKL